MMLFLIQNIFHNAINMRMRIGKSPITFLPIEFDISLIPASPVGRFRP